MSRDMPWKNRDMTWAELQVVAGITRQMLFMARVGHSEHHPNWSCSECNALRREIEDNIVEAITSG